MIKSSCFHTLLSWSFLYKIQLFWLFYSKKWRFLQLNYSALFGAFSNTLATLKIETLPTGNTSISERTWVEGLSKRWKTMTLCYLLRKGNVNVETPCQKSEVRTILKFWVHNLHIQTYTMYTFRRTLTTKYLVVDLRLRRHESHRNWITTFQNLRQFICLLSMARMTFRIQISSILSHFLPTPLQVHAISILSHSRVDARIPNLNAFFNKINKKTAVADLQWDQWNSEKICVSRKLVFTDANLR